MSILRRARSAIGGKYYRSGTRRDADCGKNSKAATIVSAAFLLYSRPAALRWCE